MNILPGNMRFGAGQPVKRLEDQRLLTGKGQFIDDKPEDGALWLHVLRSPHAHAKIVSIDTMAATGMPGVEAVYTGADLIKDDIGTIPTLAIFKRPDGKPMTVPPRRLLAHEVVRFAGEAVAAVVATSRVLAQTAAEAIEIEYEILPSVVDPIEAIKPGAPVVWPDAPDNIVAAMSYGDTAKVEEAFAKAAHTVSLDLVSQRLIPSAMEPRSTIAEIEKKTGRLILHVQSQTPGSTRDVLAEAILKRPKESVRVLVGDIGGGFGQKTNLYPEDGVVAYAATKLGRKIRWRGDRTDEFVGGTHGRDLTSTGEFALDAKGRVLAYRVRSIGGTGAYSTGAGNIIPLVLGPFVQTGVYDLPLVHFEVKSVMTNTAPVGAYRGAGRPEAVFIVERLMDAAARQIGIDPRAIRKVNYIKPAQLPYTNAVGQVYDSGAFAHMLERASDLADWNGFATRRKAAKKKGLLYGRGLTSYIEWTGGRAHTEKVSLHATAEGRIILHSGTMAMGQGLQTTYTQMVSDTLGIPMDKIDVVQGDTDLATGFGSVGSRSLFVGGTAVAVSTNDMINKAREKASNVLETSVEDIEYRDGWLTVVGTDKRISLFEIAKKESGARLSVDSEGEVDGPSWPNGTHICEVEIDPETGVSKVVRYTTVDDVGIAVNPMLVTGQVHGGVAQGIGQALYEGVSYDFEGQLLTASYQDYCVPRADDIPPITVTLDDWADSNGRRNTSSREVAMSIQKRRSHRSGRAPLPSPGRPPVAGRSELQRFWLGIARGMTSEDAALEAGISQPVGTRLFRQAGGMAPAMFKSSTKPSSGRYLSFAEREEIALLRIQGLSRREIGRRLGRSASTISRELRRNAATRSGGLEYRASTAQWHAERSARRPKLTKLAVNTTLRTYLEQRLAGGVVTPSGAAVLGPAVPWKSRRHGPRKNRRWAKAWSPEQIARRLRIDFPDDKTMRISHEAIYQALFVQGRGALRRELAACLRTGRVLRVPRARVRNRGKSFVTQEIMIRQRPAEATDRAVPGHWEGDLILGLGSSAIGTLVERTTRFTMLLHLPRLAGYGEAPRMKNGPALAGHGAEAVRDAITRTIITLPEELRRSLTWDQGAEMAQHDRLRIDAGIQVYFCDPQSPWQRGTNENTNGLLRQYFPKGTDLSIHSANEIAAVATALNARPRKTLGWKTPAEALDELLP